MTRKKASKQKKVFLQRHPKIYLRDTGHKGRGVFCSVNLAKGATLEITPGIVLNEAATAHVDKTILENYTFVTGAISKRLRQRKGIRNTDNCGTVIMGIASFCKHTNTPNAEIVWEEVDGTVYYTLHTTRAIAKNTEICTSYGAGWFESRQKK